MAPPLNAAMHMRIIQRCAHTMLRPHHDAFLELMRVMRTHHTEQGIRRHECSP